MPTERARPQRRFPWLLAAAAAAAMGARLASPSVQDRMAWVPASQAAALASAERPLLYNFTAEWCGPCKRLERDAFSDPRWALSLSRRYVPVRVVDREREDGANAPDVEELQRRYGVSAFPTLVVARADGTLLAKEDGYQGAGRLRDFLSAAHAAAQAAARKKR